MMRTHPCIFVWSVVSVHKEDHVPGLLISLILSPTWMLHLSAEVTLRYLPTSQQQFHVCFHTGVCRFRCSARLSGLLSWTQITSEALLLLPVSASWGPGLIHFCPWALARNHTDKSIGCPLMGQTLFFSTGACRVGKYVQLAGPDLSAKFSFSWQ